MDIGSILLLFAVFILAALFVTQPFFERRHALVVSAREQEHSALLAERERLMTALQELDFDQNLGKIPEGDYLATRAGLTQRAADVLRKLDLLQAAPSDAEDAGMTAQNAPSSPEADEALEHLIALRKAARKEKSAGFCPECGKAIFRSDCFCSHCGYKL